VRCCGGPSTAEEISSLDHCFGGRRLLIAFTKILRSTYL